MQEISDGFPSLKELGAKPSISEEHGLALLQSSDKVVFSPGISTGGFAEIRMAIMEPSRKIIATTIDEKGLAFTRDLITRFDLGSQIETKSEDLRGPWHYPPNSIDFIYARLVLHYLPVDDLDKALQNFARSLKAGKKIFAVVQSTANIPENDPNFGYDERTHFTSVSKYSSDGTLRGVDKRYFHTPESIRGHLEKAGFQIETVSQYEELLYHDYARTPSAVGQKPSNVIEVVAVKRDEIV